MTEDDRYMSIGSFIAPAFYRFPLDAIWDMAEQEKFFRRDIGMAVFRTERVA